MEDKVAKQSSLGSFTHAGSGGSRVTGSADEFEARAADCHLDYNGSRDACHSRLSLIHLNVSHAQVPATDRGYWFGQHLERLLHRARRSSSLHDTWCTR